MSTLRTAAVVLALLMSGAVSQAQSTAQPPTALEMATEPMTSIGENVWVAKIAPDLWVITATGQVANGTIYPANGMALESPTGTVLVDPGWTGVQTKALVEWARTSLRKPVIKAVATHSHYDRLGGVDALAELGIPMLVHPRTREIAEAEKRTHLPQAVPDLETKPYRDASGFELYFPGGGHAPDNIVVYFPAQRVVFGGCLVKSSTSTDLGNLADAVMSEYPVSIERVMRQYPERKIVVPGHGTLHGDGLAHTLKLLAEHAAKPVAESPSPKSAVVALFTRTPDGVFHSRGSGYVVRSGLVVSSHETRRSGTEVYVQIASSEALVRATPVAPSHPSELDVFEVADVGAEFLSLSKRAVRDGDQLTSLALAVVGDSRMAGTAATPSGGSGLVFRLSGLLTPEHFGAPVLDADGTVVGILTRHVEAGGSYLVVPAASIAARLAGGVEPGTPVSQLATRPPPPPKPLNAPDLNSVRPPPNPKIVTKARILNSPRPAYTEQARTNRTEGNVVVWALLGANGTVKEVRVLRGLPDGLNEKAIEAVHRLKYEPARDDAGGALDSSVTISVNFSIRREGFTGNWFAVGPAGSEGLQFILRQEPGEARRGIVILERGPGQFIWTDATGSFRNGTLELTATFESTKCSYRWSGRDVPGQHAEMAEVRVCDGQGEPARRMLRFAASS